MDILFVLIIFAFLALGIGLGQEALLPPDAALINCLRQAFLRLSKRIETVEAVICDYEIGQTSEPEPAPELAVEARRLLGLMQARLVALETECSSLETRGDIRLHLRRLEEVESTVLLAHSLVSSAVLE